MWIDGFLIMLLLTTQGLVKELDSRQTDGRIADIQRTLWVYNITDHRWWVCENRTG